jgi:outer membrane protein assembly factor BamA
MVGMWHPACLAQSDTPAYNKKLMLVVLPVIGSNPTTGFLIGASGAASKYFGNPQTTRLSSGVMGVIATVQDQVYITFKSTVFLKDDSWILQGDWRYNINSLPNWGLGTGPQSAKIVGSTGFNYAENMWSEPIQTNQQIQFNQIRIHQVLLNRYGNSNFFVGAGFRLDATSKIAEPVLNLDTIPKVITSHYAYSSAKKFNPKQYLLCGLSVDGVYDSRDNPLNPTKGQYGNVSFRINPTAMGSTQASSQLWLEYRTYFRVPRKPNHIIGLWAFANSVTSGNTPYLNLPASGTDQYSRSARPYTQGRFRGEDLLYGEVEYRYPLWKRLGGVIFANASTVSNGSGGIALFDYIDPAAGVGLRFMLNRKSRANICVDYAWGKYGAQGLVLQLGEVF